MKSMFFASTALIALATPALAQTYLPNEDVVVSATRIPTPVAEVASSVTVITAADIEARQERSLPDVLRSVPGLFITQTGGAGQLAVHARHQFQPYQGAADGIDIADPSTANGRPIFPSCWPATSPRSKRCAAARRAVWSDAIGGVINIITPAAKDR